MVGLREMVVQGHDVVPHRLQCAIGPQKASRGDGTKSKKYFRRARCRTDGMVAGELRAPSGRKAHHTQKEKTKRKVPGEGQDVAQTT